MEQQTQVRTVSDFAGGLVTFQNLFSLPPNATPNCMDVKFGIGGGVEKRLGSTTINATILISTGATGFSPDSGGTLTQNLVAWWKLDEQSGTRLDSFSTNNLADTNSVGFGAGKLRNAATFSAANSAYLSISDNAAISVGNSSFSVSYWVMMGDSSLNGMLIAHYDDQGGGSGQSWYIQYVAALRTFNFRVTNSADATTVTVSSNALTALQGVWNHVVAFRDVANSTINITVNTATVNSASAAVTVNDISIPLMVGCYLVNSLPSQILAGSADEVGLWKGKVLNTQERADLFNSGNANTYNPATVQSGFGMFDFGAGFGVDGKPLRHLVVAAGTGIYASSNRGTVFLVIATDRGADYQEFERSRSFLIAVSNTYNKVLYWAGSVGTFMAALPVGSAPPVKHALDFGGFLLLMNDSGGRRRVTYADNTKLLTDPFNSSFEISSSFDDEVTGGILYNQAAYVFTKYTVSRLTPVGGNPDFSIRQVRSWGAVPGTIKKVTLQGIGEVMICLGWDRHVRIFDGVEDRIISTPIEQNNGLSPVYLNGVPPESLDRSRAEVDTEEQVYRLWLVMTPSSNTTHSLNYDLRTGAWYPYANQVFNAAVMAESGNSRILTGVTRTGFVHWINTTNTDSGIAVDEYYDSPLLFSTPRTVTKNQQVTLYFRPTSSGRLIFQDRSDFRTTFDGIRDRILLSDTTNVLHIQKTIDVPLTQNVYQFRVSSSAATTVPWMMTRMDLQHSDLGFGKA